MAETIDGEGMTWGANKDSCFVNHTSAKGIKNAAIITNVVIPLAIWVSILSIVAFNLVVIPVFAETQEDLYVISYDTNEIKRYDGDTGKFLDNFVKAGSGGLSGPQGLAYGPDGNLYVGSKNTDQIKRYDGWTGAFIDNFVEPSEGGLDHPQDLAFDIDWNLYVTDKSTNQVKLYNGTTGKFIKTLVSVPNTGYPGPPGGRPDLKKDLRATCLAVDEKYPPILYICNTNYKIDNWRLPTDVEVASTINSTDYGGGMVYSPFVVVNSAPSTSSWMFPLSEEDLELYLRGQGHTADIVFDPDYSRVFVSDKQANVIKQYNSRAGMAGGIIEPEPAAKFNGPTGMAFGSNGKHLYFGSSGTSSIFIYTSAGFLSEFVKPNAGGLKNPTELIFGYPKDTNVPTVQISSPASGAYITKFPFVVQGIASDVKMVDGTAVDLGSGVKKVEVSVDDGVTYLPASGTNNWIYEAIRSSEGTRSIKVIATDKADQKSPATSVEVNVDTIPPRIIISTPIDGDTITASSFVIAGVAEDTGSGLQKLEISTDNGGTFSPVVFKVGEPSWRFVATRVPTGEHKVIARATDNAGNLAEKSVTIVFPSSPTDKDGDGIYDNVDTKPLEFSDSFNDYSLGGTTDGLIYERGDQVITIEDLPTPDGVLGRITGSLGPRSASIEYCAGGYSPSGIAILSPSGRTTYHAKCDSFHLSVENGTIPSRLVADDGTTLFLDVNAPNSIKFHFDTAILTAPASNPNSLNVIPQINGSKMTGIQLFPGSSTSEPVAQTPQPSVNEQVTLPLNVADSIYSANITRSLGSKNISLIPYRMTEEHASDQGFLKGVGNVTNNQTYISTHLSDELIQSIGNGTFEIPDGQSIAWISSAIGRPVDDRWVFHGIMLFNNTQSESLSLLNNSIAISKDTVGNEPDYIWLLE